MTPKDAWLATLGQLQIQMHRATFETWVDGAEFVAYEAGVFKISVRNSYAKDWMEHRLYHMVQASLSSIFRQEVEIEFTVRPPVPRPARPRLNLGDDWDAILNPAPPAPTASSPAQLVVPAVEKSHVHFATSERLHPEFTFANFTPGAANRFAHAAAQAITSSESQSLYSPLFIHSGVGMGKTHLLQAIAHECRAQGQRVLYIGAETFTNDLIRAIRSQQTQAFHDHYRNLDVLLVDDVQFIAGKESTQEEFFHTFNALYTQDARIVLAADRPPREIPGLDERLRSRFEGGLVVEIQAPDLESRLAILQAKVRAQSVELPLPAAQLLASRISHNIRALEGLLNKVLAQALLTKQALSPEYVLLILQHHPCLEEKVSPRLQDVLEATAQYYQLRLDDLLSKQRSQNIAMARHVAIYLAREECEASLPEIGRALGGRTHSTVLNSYNRVASLLESDPAFQQKLQALRQQLYAKSS